MSAIKAAVMDAMKDAMRSKDKDRLGTIRLIQAALKQIEVDERIELDDARVLTILDKMLKQRKESIVQFDAAGRTDLSDKEKAEMLVIQSFMPTPLTEQELDQAIQQAVTTVGAQSIKDMGKVMAILKTDLTGRADFGQVGAKIKAMLEG